MMGEDQMLSSGLEQKVGRPRYYVIPGRPRYLVIHGRPLYHVIHQ